MDIVIFGGTVEGRLLAQAGAGSSHKLHICVATGYGASLLPKSSNIVIHKGRMTQQEMEEFFKKTAPSYCLDATHPYASLVTANIRNACAGQKIPYIRVYRQEERNGDFASVQSVEEAAEFLKTVTGNILITTGSKELEKYTVIPDYRTRCFARVLPTVSVLEKCRELGFEGRNLIAMQGPFDEEFNYALLKQTGSTWLVTKNSGKEGGYQEKCEAALRAGANILVVERPNEEYSAATEGLDKEENGVMSLNEAIAFIKLSGTEQKEKKRKVSLIGMGPGAPLLLTGEALTAVGKSDLLVGAKRMLDICTKAVEGAEKKPVFQSYRKEEIAEFLKQHQEYEQAALLYSGDIGFYSGAKGMRELLPEFEIREISGISSPVYFLNKLGICRDQVLLVSCHGQKVNLIPLIKENKYVCVLLGESLQLAGIAGKLMEFQMDEVKITVGERLSYPEERISQGLPSDMTEKAFDSLSVALFENPMPEKKIAAPGIKDEAFIRGRVPMTKEEIRVLSLSKLRLFQDSILYDVGAGTGSVSIEAAGLCRKGKVYAIEKKHEAAELILKNRLHFRVENIEVIEDAAPDCFPCLPAPTHVFIGGSSGRLSDIISGALKKNPDARFVINAVTLETIAMVEEIRKALPNDRDMEVIQVNIARCRELSGYHLMNGENPVMIISF